MTTPQIARVATGVPTGGQFAVAERSEPVVSLVDPSPFPGVQDSDVALFTEGECGALAWELHHVTGWPVVVASDGQRHGSVGWTHAGVLRPDGQVVDVLGVHDLDAWLDDWYDEPEDEMSEFEMVEVSTPAQMSLDLADVAPQDAARAQAVAAAIADALS